MSTFTRLDRISQLTYRAEALSTATWAMAVANVTDELIFEVANLAAETAVAIRSEAAALLEENKNARAIDPGAKGICESTTTTEGSGHAEV